MILSIKVMLVSQSLFESEVCGHIWKDFPDGDWRSYVFGGWRRQAGGEGNYADGEGKHALPLRQSQSQRTIVMGKTRCF